MGWVAGWVELGGSEDKKKTFKQNWIILISFQIIEFLVIWHDPTHWPTPLPTYPSTQFLIIWHKPTHWPTHPPNHPPIHLSKGWSVSTNHKSSNRIQLSQLDDDLLDF